MLGRFCVRGASPAVAAVMASVASRYQSLETQLLNKYGGIDIKSKYD